MPASKSYTVTFSGVSDWTKGQDVTQKDIDDRKFDAKYLLEVGAIAPSGSNEAHDAKASLLAFTGFTLENTEETSPDSTFNLPEPPPVVPSGQGVTKGQPEDTLAEKQVDAVLGGDLVEKNAKSDKAAATPSS